MSDQCLCITVIHGKATAKQTARRNDLVASLGGGRAIEKNASPVENDDVMFVDDMAQLNQIASNVLLLADNQAPIFRAVPLADALAALDKAG